MRVEKHHLRRLGLAAAVLALTGCSTMAPSTAPATMRSAGGVPPWARVTKITPSNMTGPPPRIQDCAIVAISSPSRYACNGVVYSSFELLKLREAWAKKTAQGASNSTPSNSAPSRLASSAQ